MIKAISDSVPYKTQFTNGKDISFADNTPDKGGNGNGFRPHELLEAALANCMNMYIRMNANQYSIPLEFVSTEVNLDRSKSDEVCFEYSVKFDGELSNEDRQKLLDVIQSCPVRKTLSKKITFRENKN